MLHLPQIQPREPAEYHKLSSGPDKRWYRPLVAVAIFLPLYLILSVVVVFGIMLVPSMQTPASQDLLIGAIDTTDPVVFSVLMLSLIVMIPSLFVAIVFGARMGLGYFLSVEGRMRWGWLGISFAIALPLFALFIVPLFMLDGAEINPGGNLALMLVLIVLMVPFQSAAEELALRAGFLQMFGSWIPGRWPSLILGALASATVFSLLHGSLDIWILADLAFFSVCAVFLMWYTGGVEAAIAMHASNNLVIFIVEAFLGTSNSVIDSETTSTPLSFLISMVTMGTITAALSFAAYKLKITRRHDPAKTPKPDSAYLAKELSKGRFYKEWEALYPRGVLVAHGLVLANQYAPMPAYTAMQATGPADPYVTDYTSTPGYPMPQGSMPAPGYATPQGNAQVQGYPTPQGNAQVPGYPAPQGNPPAPGYPYAEPQAGAPQEDTQAPGYPYAEPQAGAPTENEDSSKDDSSTPWTI
ncbi:MAG: CPBP family glutamic-type intramembrane protease [Actinomycetaceae bacterium]|nr:CPBP family glutamic-type intramembrane protease [Actinomycetaceae bacterium]